MMAKPLLLQGCMWRIGDGSNIDIWFNHWIPDFPSIQHLRTSSQEDNNAKSVAKLLDPHTREWRVSKLYNIFPPHLTQAILKIVMLLANQPDKLQWVHDLNGIFKVKSVYRFIKGILDQNIDTTSSSTD